MNFNESIAALRAAYPQFESQFDRILAADAAFDHALSQINPPLTDTPEPCPPLHASVGGASTNVSPPVGELTDCCEHSRQSGFSSRGDA